MIAVGAAGGVLCDSAGMPERSIAVRQATLADLEPLVPLFDAYRVFYRKPSDPGLAAGR